MPGEYSWMMERRPRDTSPAEPHYVGMTQVNTEESPDASPGFEHFYMSALRSSVNFPLVETMALSPSRGGLPP